MTFSLFNQLDSNLRMKCVHAIVETAAMHRLERWSIYHSDGLVYLRIESFMIQHHQMVIVWKPLESFRSGNQDVWYSGASALFLEGTRDLVRWNSLTSVQPLVLAHALTQNMTFSWYFSNGFCKITENIFCANVFEEFSLDFFKVSNSFLQVLS